MKKLVCLFLIIVLAGTLACCGGDIQTIIKDPPIVFGRETKTPEDNEGQNDVEPTPMATPKFSGSAVCIIDTDTYSAVYGEHENEIFYIASITKLMTALVALDWLELDDTFTVKSGWLDITSKDPSIGKLGYKAGNKCVCEDLIKLALVKSFGDCAEILAGATEEVSGRDFIELMNEKAAMMGLERTSFDNVIGLDMGNNFKDNYSSAKETAILLAEAMKNKTIESICSQKSVKTTSGTTYENTNLLVQKGSGYDSFSVVGGKNGQTKLAGCTEAILFEDNENGKQYAACYLGGKNPTQIRSELTYIMEYVLKSDD